MALPVASAPKSKSEAKTEAKPEAKPEAEPEAKPEAEPEATGNKTYLILNYNYIAQGTASYYRPNYLAPDAANVNTLWKAGKEPFSSSVIGGGVTFGMDLNPSLSIWTKLMYNTYQKTTATDPHGLLSAEKTYISSISEASATTVAVDVAFYNLVKKPTFSLKLASGVGIQQFKLKIKSTVTDEADKNVDNQTIDYEGSILGLRLRVMPIISINLGGVFGYFTPVAIIHLTDLSNETNIDWRDSNSQNIGGVQAAQDDYKTFVAMTSASFGFHAEIGLGIEL